MIVSLSLCIYIYIYIHITLYNIKPWLGPATKATDWLSRLSRFLFRNHIYIYI